LISPPPSCPESSLRLGYADYSFVYFGLYDPETEGVEMFAWRNDFSLESHRRFLNEYAGEEVVSIEARINDF